MRVKFPSPFIQNPIPQLHLSLSSLPWGARKGPPGERRPDVVCASPFNKGGPRGVRF